MAIYEIEAVMLSRKKCSDGTTVLEFQVKSEDDDAMYPYFEPGDDLMLDYSHIRS